MITSATVLKDLKEKLAKVSIDLQQANVGYIEFYLDSEVLGNKTKEITLVQRDECIMSSVLLLQASIPILI